MTRELTSGEVENKGKPGEGTSEGEEERIEKVNEEKGGEEKTNNKSEEKNKPECTSVQIINKKGN